jgi:16S rRNA (cytosine967-C5)-methyltransferase
VLDLEYKLKECLALCHVPEAEYSKLFSNVPDPVQVPLFNKEDLLPHNILLSAGIEKSEWLSSMSVQPQLFIRVRRNKDKIVSLLTENGVPYSFITPSCLSLPNGAKVDTFLPADSYVVQDASSQNTGNFFDPRPGQRWYDCCTGAGGKSLLLMDKCSSVKLTVTDRRASIISNLKQRFRLYGLPMPAASVADATSNAEVAGIAKGQLFDNIICDAPCSGSGTWARTPEQMYFFSPDAISRFSALQQAITLNVSQFLKKGGRLIYITCSVFRRENEDVVDELVRNTALRPVHMELINGIARGADSMFIAILE